MTDLPPPVSVEELNGGEFVGLGALEILSVPHLSILQKRFSTTPNIDTEYKQDMARLLSEIFQSHKPHDTLNDRFKDISLELLWCTSEVRNQPFKASIRIFLIVRSIGATHEEAEAAVDSLLHICSATLEFGKYEYQGLPFQELAQVVRSVSNESINAVVKEERSENLQNPILPSCYSFDRLPVTDSDLGRIVNTLTDHPNCAVSFQLIPSPYTPPEVEAIGKAAQALGTLVKGVLDNAVGHISFTLAEQQAEIYRYYSERRNGALFAFNILVYGPSSAVNAISTRIFGQLNASRELRIVALRPSEVDRDGNFHPLPWAVSELLLVADRKANVWRTGLYPNTYYRLPYIVTAEEASEFFRLPIGSDSVSAGLVVNESVKTNRTYAADVIGGGDINIGILKASSRNDAIGLSLRDLAKHMLVVGTPGSGKTTFSVGLLDRLWKDHKIPFLVIEPAKNEYRALVQSIPDLQVFTPGKNHISPFVFNPFIPPRNVKLETYKSTLKTAFAAAVSMSTPLDKIFEDSVNNCYSDFRWLDSYTAEDKGWNFNISDFIKSFQETFDEIGYTGDAKNIGRAGIVRLGSLVNLFDNYHSIPIEDLLTKPTIIELAAIENSDQKTLLIALLLLSIQAYVNSNYIGEGGLRNVILLEEAHVLLDATSSAGPGEANPSAIAQRLLKRMLAEIRSYGVALVIADQSPRKVTPDVIALTDIKLAFRLVEAVDKQMICDSTNMTNAHLQRMSKLKPGEAFLYFSKLDEPEEIRLVDYRLENRIGITLSDDAIRSLSTYWGTRQELLRPYSECCNVPYCATTCNLPLRFLSREIARRIFRKHFNADSKDFATVKEVFSRISRLIKDELNGEMFSRDLLSCVKVHLWRRLNYGTKINLNSATVRASLSKP